MKVIHSGFDSFSQENYVLPTYPLDTSCQSTEWSLKSSYSNGDNELLKRIKLICYWFYLGIVSGDD